MGLDTQIGYDVKPLFHFIGPAKRQSEAYFELLKTQFVSEYAPKHDKHKSISTKPSRACMQFYPEDAAVPAELRTKEFHLRQLRLSDAEIDYAAVMDSKSMLRMMSQSTWPADDFTLEMNRKDLQEHEQEHDERIAFTYTVTDPTNSICLGCVYIRHLKEGPMKGDFVAQLRFWVRQPYLKRDLDRLLLKYLIDWFKNDWAFLHVIFSVNDEDKRQLQLATEMGLRLVHDYGNKWLEYRIK